MKALLVVAHGSRRKESNEEVRQLTAKIAQLDHGFDDVSCAFLELDDTLIPVGLRSAIAKGANHVTVVPYFLSAGRHVVEDIPAEVAIVQREAPEVNITISPYLGVADAIPELLLSQAAK